MHLDDACASSCLCSRATSLHQIAVEVSLEVYSMVHISVRIAAIMGLGNSHNRA